MPALVLWLFGPIGRWLIAAGAVLFALWWIYDAGHDAGAAKVRTEWDAANRAAALAAQRRDENAQAIVDTGSAERLAEAETELQTIKGERDAYVAKWMAAARVAGDCVLTGDLGRLLRHPAQRDAAGAR